VTVVRPVVRLINGEPLRLTEDFAYAEPVGYEWERPVYERFVATLRTGMTVLDVGASFGLYSIAAARGVGPDGRVFAFEPARKTAEALRRHLAWNGVADHVEVIDAAVADRAGAEAFWEHETSFLASLVEDSPRREETRFAAPVAERRLRTLTLGGFCELRGLEPDVVKIDVEGAEARVLAGARPLLERRKGVFFVEVHERIERAADALGELDAAGWCCEEIHFEPAGTRHYVCRPATA
jgi:FkbM family methyltransferase